MKRPDQETLAEARGEAYNVASALNESFNAEVRARFSAEDAKTAANLHQADVHRLAKRAESHLESADLYYKHGVECLERLAALLGKKVVDK